MPSTPESPVKKPAVATVPDDSKTTGTQHRTSAPDASVKPMAQGDTGADPMRPGDEEKEGGWAEESRDPTAKEGSAFNALGWLDRLLALWIFLAMAIGIILGNFVPDVGPALQQGKFVDVSIPIAIGLLVMMYPILCKVRYETLHRVFAHRQIWKQIGFSIFINWIVAPFFMVGISLHQHLPLSLNVPTLPVLTNVLLEAWSGLGLPPR